MSAPFNFLRPLTEEEYAGLKADIAANGQLVSIIRDQSDVTIDGHHRERALTELGVPRPRWKIAVRVFKDDDERIAVALSANHHRRQATPEDRKQIAQFLHINRGWTQEAIAVALGVSQRTVSTYVENLEASSKFRDEKRGRPKTSRKRKFTEALEKSTAKAFLDEGKPIHKVAVEHGVSEQVVIKSVAREEGRREAQADPAVTLDDIKSMGERKKAEAAIRQYQKQLDLSFEDRVRIMVLQRTADRLKYFKEREDEFERVVKSRKGVFSRATYRLILSCLHADSRGSTSEAKLNQAFNEFQKQELVLISAKENPLPGISFEDFMARAANRTSRKPKNPKAGAASVR